jgi:hypothetical protein
MLLLPGTRKRRWKVHSGAAAPNKEKVESSLYCCCLEQGRGCGKFTLLLLPGTR